MKYYLAIDLGASSGRHIVGYEENGEIVLDEVHRFANGVVNSKDGLLWDTEALYKEILIGIKKALEKYHSIESLAIDTWGVDYVLMNGDKAIAPHHAYRNERTLKVIDEVHSITPFEYLYSRTGIQFAYFNTIYQLYDDLKKGRLENATDFLMIPQYFAYLLTGVKKHEYTDASTTGLVNANTKEFDFEIINKLGLPERLFPKLSQPGETVGYFTKEVEQFVGGQIKVVLSPSHDTASAFEAVDSPEDAAFLSSGTWSLMGYKVKSAQTSPLSMSYNFTNEGGVGYIRFLKNIMGMWIPNQVQKQHDIAIVDMVNEAKASTYSEIFDVNDKTLAAPENMEKAINDLLKHNPPKTRGDLYRSIYLSLADCYGKTVLELEKCLSCSIKSIYIVGGGAKNLLLNNLTELSSHRKVVALPIEATAIGNIKTQIRASK